MHEELIANQAMDGEVRAVWMMASPHVRGSRAIVVAANGGGYMGQIQRFDEGRRARLIRAEAEQGVFADLGEAMAWLDVSVRALHRQGWRAIGRSADAVALDAQLAQYREEQAAKLAQQIQSKIAA